MYLLGLFNSLGAMMLYGASKNQNDYITELSKQYTEYGDVILDIFRNRNASTYLSMVAAKRLGFDSSVCYDLVGWNALEFIPEEEVHKIEVLHIAEMVDFYSRDMIDFYQVNKHALKLFNIEDECQFKKLVKELTEGYLASE